MGHKIFYNINGNTFIQFKDNSHNNNDMEYISTININAATVHIPDLRMVSLRKRDAQLLELHGAPQEIDAYSNILYDIQQKQFKIAQSYNYRSLNKSQVIRREIFYIRLGG